jgi:ParB family chromosome partitioning protein
MPREVRMIPIDQIEVLNPRERDSRVFKEIVANIQAIGLKKPIIVTPRPGTGDGERYLLVCGEGRLKAFKALGETQIAALIVTVSDEDAHIMSLSENIARRHAHPLERLAGIDQLRKQGYDAKTIAEKVGLSSDYIRDMLILLEHGEERLLTAVEQGRIPVNTAIAIVAAGEDDHAVQATLQEAYESGKLRGRKFLDMRRILERRQVRGRNLVRGGTGKKQDVTPNGLVRAYEREVERQRMLIRKAEFAQQRLLFIAQALRQLMAEENFANLLRAEGLDTLPKYLAERVWPKGHPD